MPAQRNDAERIHEGSEGCAVLWHRMEHLPNSRHAVMVCLTGVSVSASAISSAATLAI